MVNVTHGRVPTNCARDPSGSAQVSPGARPFDVATILSCPESICAWSSVYTDRAAPASRPRSPRYATSSRRGPVPEQEHLRAVEGERMVDLDLAGSAPGALGPAQVRGERGRLPVGPVRRGEPVERQAERRQVGRGDARPEAVVVVLRQRVA